MKSAAGQMSRLFCFGENRCRWDSGYFMLTIKRQELRSFVAIPAFLIIKSDEVC